MTLCKVYKHTLNDKVYVGQTWQNLKNRTEGGSGYKNSTHFYNAITKYGWEKVKTEILALCAEQKEADFLEEFYIKEFQSWKREYGYNLKLGGNNGRHSDESKLKMSKAHKGIVLSDEVKLKISKAKKGKVFSDETKRKMSKAQKGRFYSDEARLKLSNAHKGKIHSDETKQKISNTLKGRGVSISNAAQGRTISSGKTSIYLGVSRAHNKWKACIGYKGKVIYLGLFKFEEQAAVAYDIAAKQYFGDGAKLNFKA